ncbi:MAG: anti-sigma factor [Verrucomicrobia bacterium]|nr:anti-sigma factor [Verrucomicrobiota bacterium]
MNCEECHDYIDAYIDNELDVSATVLVEQHLRDCIRCQQLLDARKTVVTLINDSQVRFEVPDSLLGKVQSVIPASRSRLKQRSSSRLAVPWFSVPLALAATITIMLGLVYTNQRGMFDRSSAKVLAQEVISSHVRSLLGTHLLDVPSTDQHTVKPWFNGKLKFSPPVHDFVNEGFRLIGGRLDYFNGREVAAVVYQRRQHVINLFIWPADPSHNTAATAFTKDGYNVSHWARDGFEFWAVSDLNGAELSTFADLEIQQS